MSLPLKIRSRPHEPGHGALLRLCIRSGRTAVPSFAKSLGLDVRSVLAGHNVGRIADLAGLATASIAWLSPVISIADRVVAIAGEELALGDWSVSRRRHCPDCLRADTEEAKELGIPCDWLASHRSWWDIRSIVSCPLHGVALVDTCANCCQPFGWRDARRLSCYHCHVDLTSRGVALDDPLGKYVAARMGVGPRDRVPVLDELPLRFAVRLCGKLGRAGLNAAPERSTTGVPSLALATEGMRRARLGSSGLDDIFDREISRRAGGTPDGLGGAYGWLHNEWLGTEDPSAEPYRAALRRHAVAAHVIAQDEDRLGASPPPTISVTAAAAAAGVAFARMRKALDEAGAIPEGSRRGVAFAIDPEAVALAAKPRGATRRAALDVLGVGRKGLAGLAAAGLIDTTDEAAVRGSATRLLATLDRQLCAGRFPHSAIPTTRASVAASVPLALLVEHILQGGIPAWGADTGTGLSAIMVRPIDIIPLRNQPEGHSGVSAARTLGLHQDTVRALLRCGALPRDETGLIPFDAVEKFRSGYITGSELAGRMGCSPAAMMSKLVKSGISPAWPLATHRQAVFLRQDVRGWDAALQ